MNTPIENAAKYQVLSGIQLQFTIKISASTISLRIVQCLRTKRDDRYVFVVCQCCCLFKYEQINKHDEARSERPSVIEINSFWKLTMRSFFAKETMDCGAAFRRKDNERDGPWSLQKSRILFGLP